jgi:LmbE family N-acetylglucosaminyl deacetylase
MAAVFILAHFDDEYCALPLILQAQAAGEACWFLYVADYRAPGVAARRLAETRAFLSRFGTPPQQAVHVGAGSGVFDGAVAAELPTALERLRAALEGLPSPTRLVTPAWEGGHPDHDCCAALATILASERGAVPVIQFGLYNGRHFPRPFYRACSPIPENGPTARVPLSAAHWLAWIAAVRFFPSQAWNWLGLWPSMFMTFARQGGFACQQLAQERIEERPHAGRLHYEWMFATPYAQVRAAVDGVLAARGQRPGRARIRKKPTIMNP